MAEAGFESLNRICLELVAPLKARIKADYARGISLLRKISKRIDDILREISLKTDEQRSVCYAVDLATSGFDRAYLSGQIKTVF